MIESGRPSAREYFNRRHLAVIIATLFVSLHIVDELVRGEELAPPFIPLLVIASIWVFLPWFVQVVAAIGIGGIFFVAQIIGHVLPTLENGPSGSDYTGLFPMIGGLILAGVGMSILRERNMTNHIEQHPEDTKKPPT